MQHSFFVYAVVWALVSAGTTAAGQEDTSKPVVHYSVAAGFAYVDRYSRPSFNMVQTQGEDAPEGDQGGHRSLGLTHLRLAIDWIAFAGADFHIVLRPDAVNRVTDGVDQAREFDSRAGDVYRPQASQVKLLDTYHLRFASGDSFAAAVGVFESISAPVGAYPSLLDFGLFVRMPEKFAGLEVSWRNFSSAATREATSGFAFDLIALHGDEDRVEGFASKEESYDLAPAAEDPYYGAGLRMRWIPRSAMNLGAMGASYDSQIEGGRKTETLLQLYSEVVFDYLDVQPKLALEFRFATEKWRTHLLDIAPKTQQNVALTSSVRVGRKSWVLLGGHLGRSDREKPGMPSEAVPANGYQVEAGLLGKFDGQLSWQFMFNEEQREIVDETGEVRGGFVNASGARRTLRRVAFSLQYFLDANG